MRSWSTKVTDTPTDCRQPDRRTDMQSQYCALRCMSMYRHKPDNCMCVFHRHEFSWIFFISNAPLKLWANGAIQIYYYRPIIIIIINIIIIIIECGLRTCWLVVSVFMFHFINTGGSQWLCFSGSHVGWLSPGWFVAQMTLYPCRSHHGDTYSVILSTLRSKTPNLLLELRCHLS